MKAFDLRFEAAGSVVIGGERIAYSAVSESFSLGPKDAPEATIFSYTYLREGLSSVERKRRPVLFSYNGGPGSSCLWLHLGLMGPTRVKFDNPIDPDPRPPFVTEDNPHSPLNVCDVVMIDPVGTGFARLLKEDAAEKYYGIDEDAAAIAKFIEHWLIKYDRWDSPKYLAGESYGTVRSGVLASALMGGPFSSVGRASGISIDGVILMGSSMLNGTRMDCESIEPSVLNLPTMAATRWYHYPVEGVSVEDFVEEAYDFCQNEYLAALYAGNRLSKEKIRRITEALARFTGMPAEYLKEKNLRIDNSDFLETVCKDKGTDVGLYDSRYTVPHEKRIGKHDTVSDDAAMGLYVPPFIGAMNGVKRGELGIDTELSYDAIVFREINSRWNYKRMRTPIECFTAAMRRNKEMRIMFVTGRYDLVTTMGYVRYIVSQGKLPLERVLVKEYNSGHMPYLGEDSAAALSKDIRDFVERK